MPALWDGCIESAVTRCPSISPQNVEGVGYMLPLANQAACNPNCMRYQLKKGQGPNIDPSIAIAQLEEMAMEIDEMDQKGAGPLSNGGLKN